MIDLLTDATFSDFKIVCGDKTFNCHKNIVANKSDVLQTMMLSKDWTENKKNTLLIEDFEPKTVEQMLRFVYTGECDKYTVSLLHIANKYNIKRLVSICEQELIKSINLSNATKRLQAADLIGRKHLKERAVGFVAKNIKALIDTPEWSQEIETSTELLSAILRKVIKI